MGLARGACTEFNYDLRFHDSGLFNHRLVSDAEPLGLGTNLCNETSACEFSLDRWRGPIADPFGETGASGSPWAGHSIGGAAHRELWKALWDRGRSVEVVAIVRTPEEDSRAETVLANWARDPRPSEFDHGIGREIDLIDQAIIKGDVPVLMEYGGLQAAMKRSVALTKRARRQAGRGLMQRTDTWRTVRLAGARFR